MLSSESGPQRIGSAPSLVELAVISVRGLILAGQLKPGERLVENRLTTELGISRPPLREALRILELEGLVVQQPRRGVTVRAINQHDVYEIVTLRRGLESLAVELGVPVRNPAALARLEDAVIALENSAAQGDEASLTTLGFAFHLAFVGLACSSRLESAFRSIAWQMQLCMTLNRTSLREIESPAENAARHRLLYEAVVEGDKARVLQELDRHRSDHFLVDVVDELEPGTSVSDAWLIECRSR